MKWPKSIEGLNLGEGERKEKELPPKRRIKGMCLFIFAHSVSSGLSREDRGMIHIRLRNDDLLIASFSTSWIY